MNCMTILAYVDPGSGALLWQMLVAFGVGFLFYIRKFREFVFGLAARCLRSSRRQKDTAHE
jgi:hypothetical protein